MSGPLPPPRTPVRPVRRRVLLLALAGTVLLLVGVIAGVDLLRHPPTGGEPAEIVDADPRDTVPCPEAPEPAEAQGPAIGGPVEAATVTSNGLYDCPLVWDRQPVSYRGEVVGAVLRRGDHAWVHLNDDVYAGDSGPLPAHRDFQGGNGGVGVRIPADLAEQISWVGGGRARGDILEVRGTYYRVHRGSREPAVIIATTGQLVTSGSPFVDPVLTDRAVAAVVLSLLAGVLVVIERGVARKRR